MFRRAMTAVLVLSVLTACGGTAATSSNVEPRSVPAPAGGAGAATTSGAAPDAAQPAAPAKATGGGAAGAAPAKSSEQEIAQQFGRKVILNATIALLVKNVSAAEQSARTLAQNLGGYVLQSQTSGDDEHRSVHLTFKVPAARFDDAVNALEDKGFASKVLNHSVSGQDVTDEYVDLESRQRNLKETEARLIDFLHQAKTVDEALRVNDQLTDLQGQIEQVTGRINFLSKSTAFSTINLDLQPDLPLVVAGVAGWRPGIAASAAWHNLLTFAESLADVAIVLAIWSPVWGVLLLAALIAWRRFGRRPIPPQPSTQP